MREHLEEHGWTILRGIYSPEEIASLRTKATPHAGDILSHPNIAPGDFIAKPEIVEAVRDLLGANPIYFGDSTVSINADVPIFHKDSRHRFNSAAPDFQPGYKIVRVGLYLQDHEEHSGGLSVRDRSHLTGDNNWGRPISLPSRIGDIVVWYLTTTHSGAAMRYRFTDRFASIRASKALRNRWFSPLIFKPAQYADRLALFATYGAASDQLDQYIAYLKTRRYAVDLWTSSKWSTIPENLQVRQVDLTDVDESKVTEHYVAPL